MRALHLHDGTAGRAHGGDNPRGVHAAGKEQRVKLGGAGGFECGARFEKFTFFKAIGGEEGDFLLRVERHLTPSKRSCHPGPAKTGAPPPGISRGTINRAPREAPN